MSIYMTVFKCICMHEYMYVCMHVCIYVCIYVIFKLGVKRYDGNCPSWEGNCPGGIVRGKCPGGNCPGGKCPGPEQTCQPYFTVAFVVSRMGVGQLPLDKYAPHHTPPQHNQLH